MINSVYGKIMENLRKRINVRLVNNAKDYKNYVNKPSFVLQKIFSKYFVAFHEIKPALTLDKPIYVGFSVLDLNELLMYDFKITLSKTDVKLLFTDTENLVCKVKTDDVY